MYMQTIRVKKMLNFIEICYSKTENTEEKDPQSKYLSVLFREKCLRPKKETKKREEN